MTFIAYLLAFVFFNYVWWLILGKMGFSDWVRLGLVAVIWIPGVGLLFELVYLGFFEWPIHEDLEAMRKRP
jgi:hypothetical protein